MCSRTSQSATTKLSPVACPRCWTPRTSRCAPLLLSGRACCATSRRSCSLSVTWSSMPGSRVQPGPDGHSPHRPLVTIGLPVYNGASRLSGALRALRDQDYPNLEILVSDNASSDATWELVADASRG